MGVLVDVVGLCRSASPGGTRSRSGRGRPRRSASSTARRAGTCAGPARRPRGRRAATGPGGRSARRARRRSVARAVGADRAAQEQCAGSLPDRRARPRTAARSDRAASRGDRRRREPYRATSLGHGLAAPRPARRGGQVDERFAAGSEPSRSGLDAGATSSSSRPRSLAAGAGRRSRRTRRGGSARSSATGCWADDPARCPASPEIGVLSR